MFEHICVPTDTSAESRRALELAGKMQLLENPAPEGHCKITLLHVVEAIAHEADNEFESFYAQLIKRAEAKMEDLIAASQTQNLFLEKRIVIGNRTREILDFVQNNSIDLIILMSHRVDPDNLTQGWGTISHKVGILAPCPVMLVK